MHKLSRRELARWAAEELIAGRPARDVARHLAAVLAESGRTSQVGFLIGDITWQLEQRRALAVGHVTSAVSLGQQLEEALAARIKEVTKVDKVLVETEIDKSVIGGIRIETANHVWDQTIARKLSELREIY